MSVHRTPTRGAVEVQANRTQPPAERKQSVPAPRTDTLEQPTQEGQTCLAQLLECLRTIWNNLLRCFGLAPADQPDPDSPDSTPSPTPHRDPNPPSDGPHPLLM